MMDGVLLVGRGTFDVRRGVLHGGKGVLVGMLVFGTRKCDFNGIIHD